MIKVCTDAGFVKTVEVTQHLMTKHVDVVSTLYHEMTNYLNQKVGSKEIPKLVPYWKLQPAINKVETEWKSELNQ